MAQEGTHELRETSKQRFNRVEQPKLDIARLSAVIEAAANGEKLTAADAKAARLALKRLSER